MTKKKKLERKIEKIVDKVLQDKFASVLHDISYRIGVLLETQKGMNRVHSHDLNLATHLLDGYVFTNNSPQAGYVAWTDVNIVYKGVTYTITNGNTNKKYIWWDFDATDNTKLQASDTKPTLTVDDVLIGINEGGTFHLTMAPGKMTPGGALLDGSVGSNELATGAVTTAKLADLAITSQKISDSAITETKIASNAITSVKIASNAVDSSKIADNAITQTKIANGAVVAGKLGSNAVTSSNIASGAVGSTQIADNAVTSTKIATNAISSTHIQSGAVGSSQLANGAVTGTKIAAGAIAEDKLNLATHFIF
ncbi:hypothetical protein [Saccharococcus caldoxylosilyticus]|uniref:Uncharacterized protein n=1 Tax=Saccharococcus caldoxylosilyticus TaxID=81408 RepID=A0A150LBL9_9BACL|nr:hypothetical protein [Parageobacillus caldoxylosilyticus]KYD09645.1 hypothetical protein B4119_2493 [Parageobacillus caldoxylosilyticus]